MYLDWNDEVIDIKLQNLSTVILSEDVDIIGLQEVENIGMLERLYNRVKQNGYVAYDLIEGQDERGIDLGIISKFPIKKSILHRMNLQVLPHKHKEIHEEFMKSLWMLVAKILRSLLCTFLPATMPAQCAKMLLKV